MAKHTLSGSDRTTLAGAHCVGPADPGATLKAVLVVRHRDAQAFAARVGQLAAGDRSQPHLSRDAFATQFGAAPEDLAAVTAFAQQHGLTVVRTDAASRMVVVSGTVAQFNAAFEVDLQQYQHPAGNYRGRTGTVSLPDALHGVVTAVLGLDNRPQARAHFRFRPPVQAAASPAAVSYSPTQVAGFYQFPESTGAGQCIALIELGGGYTTSDLSTYFSGLGITAPTVVAVPVDGGSNQPTGSADGPDGEVMLDIEVAGAIAPGAKIAVYFAGNTDAGFIDAVSNAVHDTVNRPSVVSISWGGPESSWTSQSMQAFNEVLQAAATLGVTVCVASGDNGSSDGVSDQKNHVDFPASSPYSLACGGTSLRASGNTIASEVVCNDGAQGGAGGGGVSGVFALPAWQQGLSAVSSTGASTPLGGRGVPDVAGNADPQTGYNVRVDGSNMVVGGTSAVAPLWAALIARINATQGKAAGYINPLLYQQGKSFNDITKGNNGSFEAVAGWDACTGLGSPDGQKLLTLL